jgi:hypothetical protein
MFVDLHAEQIGEFSGRAEAIAELRRLVEKPWNEPPNRAPCMSWEACGRQYVLIEYDVSITPWREIRRVPALNVSREETAWLL